MPKEYKFVCYKHKHVSKRGGHCPVCRTKLYCLGDRARIPRKANTAGWLSLKEWVILTRGYDLETNQPVGPQDFNEKFKVAEANSIGKK